MGRRTEQYLPHTVMSIGCVLDKRAMAGLEVVSWGEKRFMTNQFRAAALRGSPGGPGSACPSPPDL